MVPASFSEAFELSVLSAMVMVGAGKQDKRMLGKTLPERRYED
jgi:hypothetical protein